MKRARSCSLAPLPPNHRKFDRTIASLTSDALQEHNKSIQPLSPLALFYMSPQQKTASVSDVPIILPSSTRSSQRSRSSSPSRPSDAQYRAGYLRRANMFVDNETPADICDYTDKKIFYDMMDDAHLYQISEKL